MSTPDFAPITKATSPCPAPSCRMFVRMPATMLIAQIVRMSSGLGAGLSCCEATAVVEIAGICLSIPVRSDCSSTLLRSREAPVTSYTNPSAATIGCTRGTGFPSTDGGRGGTLLPYRKCSNRARSYKTIGLLWGRPTAERAADARMPFTALWHSHAEAARVVKYDG